MNEEIDETEFYHQDFTTASEWEIFIAQLEEIITQWKIDEQKDDHIETSSDIWQIKTENVTFVDFDFTLLLYRKQQQYQNISGNVDTTIKKNPFDNHHDFKLFDPNEQNEHSCLSDWYGIDEFIVLSPSGNVGITTETRIKTVLSSIYVIVGNLKCETPVFVQIRDKWQHCYLGVYQNESTRTNLEMIHLRTGPRLCQYLSGLLELFKSKIVSPTMLSTILVALQSTYVLTDFGSFLWNQHYPNADDEHFDTTQLLQLPFGVTVDPINQFILKTTWSHLNHRSVRDCESYTYFNPLDAQKWSILTTTTEQPICLLGECLIEFLHTLNNTGTIQEILGDFINVSIDTNNPLDLLTEPKVPTISTLITKAARNSISKSRRVHAPLSDDILVSMLYFLFPDAVADSQYNYKDATNQSDTSNQDNDDFKIDYECRGFKTCQPDGLIWRLAIVLSHCLQSLGGIRAFSHLWYEFVQEMRYRWEKCIPITGLLPGYPDLRTNLLHQKLQMLNCCIDRKQSRENNSTKFESAESSSSDEEFFDCEDTENNRKSKTYSLWNQPVGRLGKFNDLKLLKSGDPLYIPVTQEPVPKTEDQLEEDTDVLLRLGSDAQGSELRAKMMSASLLSDMESFKAANPGSVLEDFIRWYSPRDWIDDDDDDDDDDKQELDEWGQKRGHLSTRMMIEDNFWVQTWQSSKPVPAHRQKRLFDDTREAEKVLHYLDSRNLSQICELLIPILCHVTIYRLADELRTVTIEFPDAADRLRNLAKTIVRISREHRIQPRRFESFIQEVTALELKVSEINSLMYKLNPSGGVDEHLSNSIGNLISGREIEINDKSESEIGKRIISMFSEQQRIANMIIGSGGNNENIEDGKGTKGTSMTGTFPQAHQREIVMRVSVNRPATYSVECPQFMRAILGKNEFRLVGAFSEDIVFF